LAGGLAEPASRDLSMTAEATASLEHARGSDRLRARVRTLLVVVYALLASAFAIALLINRNEAAQEGQRRAETLAFILGDHLVRTVSGIDTTLAELALIGSRVGGSNADGAAWGPLLETAKSGVSGIAVLAVTDETGVIRHATMPLLIGTSRADGFLFRRLSADPSADLVVDKPLRGSVSGQWVIPFGRRLVNADGKFGGIVVATLEPGRLRQFYRTIDIGRGGVISVLHPEQAVLFREPSSEDPSGQFEQDNPLVALQNSGATSGFLHAPLTRGGASYFTAYRVLANPPLSVAVSLAETEILGAWWASAITSGVIMAAFGALLLIVWRMIMGEIRARAEAEQRQQEQASELTSALERRERSEEALRATQTQFQSIMDHSPMQVCLRDLQGRFIFVNKAYVDFSGETEERILGRTFHELRPKEHADAVAAQDREVIASRKAMQWEMTVPKPQGPRTVLIVKFPIYDKNGAIILVGAIVADVTEQKRAEAQVVQAQRIDSLGQLTGGIAHDFNNLLTSILLNADVLASVLDDKLRPLAESVRMAAERGADLTRRLLAFGRRQMLEPRPTDIRELLASMEALLHRTLGEHIEIRTVHEAGLWHATIDPGQLENAVLNLAVNARDAMANGGRLTIETGNVELDAAQLADVPEGKPGQYVTVAVCDTGSGMTAEVAARAFEPFFTTKDVGKGTGLGLSMVYGFVKQSGGHVRITSDVGVGTVVRLYLPRSAEVQAAASVVAPGARDLPRGSETILFVEDDPMVREHTGKQIVGLGYAVITAENALEAVQLADDGYVPDLLFTDVVMPGGMNGRQLALKLRERWPNLRVLYTSGYAHGQLTIDGESVPSKYVLGKPYRRADLAAKLREILDEPVVEERKRA
jgi:PAS domain S-box-containing protein